MKLWIYRFAPSLWLNLGALFLFSIFAAWTQFPIQADDYAYLNLASQTTNYFLGIKPLVARMPLSTILSYPIFLVRIPESHPKLLLIVCFALHCLAFAHLMTHYGARFFGGLNEIICFSRNWSLAIAATIFALHPNNYEIHLWHGLATHQVGFFLLACSFTQKSFPMRLVGATMSFLIYDTFPLLLVGLCGLDWLASMLVPEARVSSRKIFTSSLLLCLSSTAATLFVKGTLAWWIGEIHQPGAQFSLLGLAEGLKNVVKTMGFIHFYKENWVLSCLEILLSGFLITSFFQIRTFRRQWVVFLVAWPMLVALPLCLMRYSAVRAFYGPNIVKQLILGIFLYSFAQKKWWRFVAFLFLVTYGVQWIKISSVKNENWQSLGRLEHQFQQALLSCPPIGCKILAPPPGTYTRRDWVVPEMFNASYYEWLKLKHHPKMPVQIVVTEEGYDQFFMR